MPSHAEIESALQEKAVEGKISAENLMSSVSGLGLSEEAVSGYVSEHKDAEGNLDVAGATTFLSSL